MLGVPSVGSRAIPWLPLEYCVNNPNDPQEIAIVGETLLERQGLGLRAHLIHWASISNAQLRDTFEAL